MTSLALRLFLVRVFDDQVLEDALTRAGADPVAIAASLGYTIDEDEFRQSINSWDQWRLTSAYDDDY